MNRHVIIRYLNIIGALALAGALLTACGSSSQGTGASGSSHSAAADSSTQKNTDVRELLADYLDADTRIIYVDYDGLERDVASYSDEFTAGMTEEDRKARAEFVLKQQHLLDELEDAVEKREDKVCVIGIHTGGGTAGYDNTSSQGYGNGEFRQMAYSAFWLKSEEMGWSWFDLDGRREYYYIYQFHYYDLTDADIRRMKAQIDAEADAIIACVPAGASNWEKYKIVHDELIRRDVYDHSFGDHCHDLYGALVTHRPVCEGYALAYRFILNRMGLKCGIILNDMEADTEELHSWNVISENTNERYIDVTWDDPDYVDASGQALISYDFFGLTRDEATSIDSHAMTGGLISWSSNPEPYNYFRREGYMFPTCDTGQIVNAFIRQKTAGQSYLSVRFDNEAAYQEACSQISANGSWLTPLFDTFGIPQEDRWYWYTSNDAVRTVSIWLGDVTDLAAAG